MKKILCIIIVLTLTACQSITSIIPESQNAEETTTTLTWYINFSWFNKSWGIDATSKYITEQTGINIEYIVPSGNETEKLQSMISSGMTPDIITIESYDNLYSVLLEKNLLSPLNILNEEYETNFFENTSDDTVAWYEQNDGNIYVYPNSSYSLNDLQEYSTQTFLVRKDIYEAIGSPDMSTPEGFLQALSDAQNMFPQVNGKSLIPLGLQEFSSTSSSSIEEYLQNFLAIAYEIDGEIYDRFTDPEYISWLKTLNEAYNMGLIATDVFVDKRVQMEEKIAEGRYFAMLYQWADCSEQLQKINEENPEQNYIAIDGPKNSNGDSHTLSGSNIQGWTITGISSSSKYQEESITLLSYLMSDEGQKLIFLGVENDSYNIVNDEIIFDKEVLRLFNSNKTEYSNIFGGATTHWPMMNNVYANNMGYNMPFEENIQSIKEWTSTYTTNFSLYSYGNYRDNLEVQTAYKIDTESKANLIPKLLLAESEEEFDILFQNYLISREENNYEIVLAENQKILDFNKEKLFSY